MQAYLLTGKEADLKSYRASLSVLPAEIRALAKMVHDSPTQKSRTNQVSEKLSDWESLAMVRAARRTQPGMDKGFDEKHIMERVHADLDLMEADEQRVLLVKTQDLESKRTIAYFLLGLLLPALGGLLTFFARGSLSELTAIFIVIFKKEKDLTAEAAKARAVAEREREESNRHLRKLGAVLHNLSDGVLFVTPDGLIQSMNKDALKLHEFSDEQEMLRSVSDLRVRSSLRS